MERAADEHLTALNGEIDSLKRRDLQAQKKEKHKKSQAHFASIASSKINLKDLAAEGSKQNEIDLLRQQSSKQAAELDNVKELLKQSISAFIKSLPG